MCQVLVFLGIIHVHIPVQFAIALSLPLDGCIAKDGASSQCQSVKRSVVHCYEGYAVIKTTFMLTPRA